MKMKRNEYEAVQCAPPSEKDEEIHTWIFDIIPKLGVETLVSYLPLPAQFQQRSSDVVVDSITVKSAAESLGSISVDRSYRGNPAFRKAIDERLVGLHNWRSWP